MLYDRSQKRRLVDSCGHERCFTCIGRNDLCSLCLQAGLCASDVSRNPHKSPNLLDRDLSTSLSSKERTDTSQDQRTMVRSAYAVLQTIPSDGTLERTKRTKLADTSQDSGFISISSISPDNTLPRRRKQVSRQNSHDLQKSNSATSVESYMTLQPTHASLFSRRPSKLSTGHLYTQILQPKFPKPLYFEVPQCVPCPLSGRKWLFHEIRDHLSSHLPTNRGVILVGGPGVGKTACILSLVEKSCFGNGRESMNEEIHLEKCSNSMFSPTEDNRDLLSRHIVAYHFCQADNAPTCLLPEFVHSISAQMSQAPQLAPYFHLLQSDQDIQARLSLASCNANPGQSLITGILEPLNMLSSTGKIPASMCIIVVDGLCEAEQHRPDYGDTLTSFLAKHLPHFPSWLKIICTVRSSMFDTTRVLPFHKICLDSTETDERLNKDLSDYIAHRLKTTQQLCSKLQKSSKLNKNLSSKLTSHLLSRAKGCFLYVKLILDFIEKGSLVIKAGSFKVLPQNLSEIYHLAFNLKFSTSESFDQVSEILSISLASLHPINLHELFTIFSALSVRPKTDWKEFKERYLLISDVLVMRKDGSVMFFHPTLRDWLLRRKDGDSTKFLCDIKTGHTAIALSITRRAKIRKPEKLLVLAHHILKSNMYKNLGQEGYFSHRELQACFVSFATDDMSAALGCTKNIFAPILKVSRLLLLSGANPNYVTDHMDHCPLLGMYSYQGNNEMVSLLLEFGANTNEANDNRLAPLSLASGAGHLDIVQLLVQFGAKINSVDNKDQCAMVVAAYGGHMDVLEYLLAQDWDMDVTIQNIEPEEALQQSVIASIMHAHLQMTGMLLDLPCVDIDAADTLTGLTPLFAATKVGDRMCVEMLIKRNADIDQRDDVQQQAAIHVACREGHRDIVCLLLEHGSCPNQADGKGRTPLMLSSAGGHVDLTELLLAHGGNIEDTDNEQNTPLMYAVINGQCEIAQYLLSRAANVNAMDSRERSSLELSVHQGNSEMVSILLENGANIDKQDTKGLKPMDRAVGSGNAAVVSVFLKKGAKLGPATWMMADENPEIQLILLNKLLEDGNTLYRQNLFSEAAHRYQYAIKRLPRGNTDLQATFSQLETHLLLNLSRCERRQGHHSNAVHLASQVITSHPQCPEAFIARAKARKAMGKYKEAVMDYSAAFELVPNNKDIEVAINKLKEEISCKNQLVKLPLGFASSESIQFMDDCSTVCSSNKD